LASLSNRFSYFENFNEKEETRKKKSRGGDEEGLEVDSARRECKAKSLVNKFKEMETRAANGESEVTAHDPDKPIISALGFLGKLPGGKCFSLLMQPLSNTRFQKVEFLSKNPKISINFLISNFQLKILNFLNHIRFQFGEKL